MRLRIHHGAAQVGGNCIELQSGGKSLLLDLGLPLDSAPVLPQIEGLAHPDDSLLGVVLSHPHLDHYGLLPAVRADLPVWLGKGAINLLSAAAPFTAGSVLPQRLTPYESSEPFQVGPFNLTPYLMDHSAFDAHALLIEAGGKRVFYTGDFRGHGRKARTFEQFLSTAPRDIDVLLMEGTSVGRTGEHQSEADVEAQAAELMRKRAGLTLLCFSGQNIDRFVSFLRASTKAGRTFVVDPYMAALVAAAGMRGLPDLLSHPNVRIYLPKGQKRMIVRDQRFDLVQPYKQRRIYIEEIARHPERHSLMFRTSMLRDLEGVDLAGGGLIYSLWPGYLDRDRTDLRAWAAERGLAFDVVHSSGHASESDLRRIAQALKPKRLIPIHTEKPAHFERLYDAIEIAQNGAWIEV
ncbi:MAG: lactamase [Caulobacteraceae bacterium]|nr:lactamase [Caulobacteraceae bacterium]